MGLASEHCFCCLNRYRNTPTCVGLTPDCYFHSSIYIRNTPTCVGLTRVIGVSAPREHRNTPTCVGLTCYGSVSASAIWRTTYTYVEVTSFRDELFHCCLQLIAIVDRVKYYVTPKITTLINPLSIIDKTAFLPFTAILSLPSYGLSITILS